MPYTIDFQSLIEWFQREKRDLPWRSHPTPYVVWVSEVMLQQTQVSVVISYFERWMKRFPTVKHLAEATVDEVMKLWEGLGYYSRARSLLEGSRYVLEEFGGEIPESPIELSKIKGLGPYTIGAIRSFAFHQRASAVDGNVLRVLARYFQIEEDIAKEKTVRKFREIAEQILPQEEHWVVNEALIELGATVCGKSPKCRECPLRKTCQSYQNGVAKRLPYKSTKIKTVHLHRAVAVIHEGPLFLVRRGQAGRVMHDLYEFPYFELTRESVSIKLLMNWISKEMELDVKYLESLPDVTHSFTKYRAHLQPMRFSVESRKKVEEHQWLPFEELDHLAFSSGHRKIYGMIRGDTGLSFDSPHTT